MKMAYRSRLLATTLFIGSGAFAAPAFAQDTAPPANPKSQADVVAEGDQPVTDEVQGEVVVTGSLIRNPNLVSSSPVSVVGQEEVQLRQANNAETILRDVPGATPNLGQNVNNGQVGSSRVDLRGLGSFRNLVLLDGDRITPSSSLGVVDLNNIPLALISRVDILTGGASTTYGADAISGVVNFITRADFAGADLQASEQITEKGDGNVLRADLTIGANFDDGRGNAVISLGYQEADAIYQGDRDVSLFGISSTTGVASGSSFTSVPTTISFPGADRQLNAAGTALVPFYQGFNFNPYNIFVTPFKRYNIYAAGHFDITDDLTVYGRGLFSKNTVASIIAPSGIFGNSLTIPGNNPYLPAAVRDEICTRAGIALGATCNTNAALPLPAVYRRTVELGPRTSTYVTQVFDYQAGAKYRISDHVSFDAYGAYGESENTSTQSGYVANSRVQQALNATNTTTCTVTANGCVPLNLFGPAGSITAAQAGFIGGITSSVTNRSTLSQFHGVLSGDFGFTSPGATVPVSFAVGGEYRDYSAQVRPDSLAQIPGELGGAGGATLPLSGGYHVSEAFGELIAPLIADRPFFHELTIEGGIRYSKYTVEAPGTPKFNATSYKGGVTFAPVRDVKFRGNYQHAVRAPNITELFAPVVTGLTNLQVDPCAGTAPVGNANLTAICRAQGAPLASIGLIQNPSAGQANITGGGNPNIRPEKADTYTLGVVLQPRNLISGLTITVDYYNIDIKDAITTQTPADSLAACFGNITAASAASAACTVIGRNPANGRLSGTSTAAVPILGLPGPLTNNGRLKTDGVDLNANFKHDLGFAKLDLNFAGNYTHQLVFQAAPTSIARQCTGYYSANCGLAGSIQPKYAWTQRSTLSFDNIDLSVLWRHTGRVQYEGQADNFLARGFSATSRNLYSGVVTGPSPLAGNSYNFNRIKAYNYFDLAARFRVGSSYEFAFTATNVFDKKPPVVGSTAGSTAFNSGNTFPSTYDAVGRRFAASARLKF